MDVLQIDSFAAEPSTQCIPAVISNLIEAAVAAFDVDRTASLRDLLRAAAILRARASDRQRTQHPVQQRGGLVRWQMNRIIDYIDQHIAEKITGEDLARLINVSTGQLFRAFKASVGTPPLQYVAARRVELACSLLRTTQEPLSQVALACGFCDQSHLCRVFRRVVGASPTVWRRAQAHDPQLEPCRWPEPLAQSVTLGRVAGKAAATIAQAA
jgi:AraC family transcriptional regulator